MSTKNAPISRKKREGCENLCLSPVITRAARDRVARIALPLAALKHAGNPCLDRLLLVARIALPLAALKLGVFNWIVDEFISRAYSIAACGIETVERLVISASFFLVARIALPLAALKLFIDLFQHLVFVASRV